MSKILRRPMFRGGPVDSRGTGITSGLTDKPKRGLVDEPGGYAGEIDLFNIFKDADRRGYKDFTTGGDLNPIPNTFDINSVRDTLAVNRNILDQQDEVEVGSDGDIILKTKEDIFEEDRINKEADQKKANEMGVSVSEMKAIEKENLTPQSIKDQELEKMLANQPDLSPTGNEPSSTVIDEKALIREQAELFKELLGEQDEKKLKDARISDASDYLLKFFEGSQKEGATVGSSAADVASFATSKDSKTERAKAQIEKGNQTATALAINDYIAGKRSKEQVQSMIAGLKLKSEFAKGSLGQNIMAAAAKAGGTITVGGIETIVRGMNQGAEVVRITEQQVKDGYEVSGADNGKFLIEEGTKNVFEVINGNKVRRY